MTGLKIAAAACAAWMTAAAALAAPTLEDYGRRPSVAEVDISPDGSKLAILIGDAAHLQLQIRETASRKLVFAASLGSVKVRALQWAGNHHLLTINSVTAEAVGVEGPKQEWLMATDLNLNTRKVRRLLDSSESSMNSIARIPTVLMLKGKPTAFVEGIYFPGRQGVLALYRIDLESGRTDRIEEGNENTSRFLVGPDGVAVARSDYNERSGRWALMVREKGLFREAHIEIAPIDHPFIRGLGRDGQSVLVGKETQDGTEVFEVSLKDRTWSGPVQALEDKDILEDPLTRTPIGAKGADMEHTVYDFLSPRDQGTWNAVVKAFPDEDVELASWSDDRRHVVVKVEGNRDGAAYFVLDLSSPHGTADWLADEYAGVAPEAIAEKRVLTYKAADGFEVPAYLTLPKGRPEKGLPLVVLVHGGPAARDDPGFDWWSQALASRGYAVLQPQYRGSSGFGEAHEQAGYGQYGRKMQTDLSDGVRFLTRSGLADPKRVCIVGGSYGGYAALAGAVFDSEPYRCAISVSGISDQRRFLGWIDSTSDGAAKSTIRYWDRFMGAKSRSDPVLDDISPALHADKAAMPILLIHGLDDTVVPYEQSKIMEAALKRAGKPVELVTLKGEDHWLSRSETRLQMLTAAVSFLEAHNPPDAPSAAGPKGAAPAAAATAGR